MNIASLLIKSARYWGNRPALALGGNIIASYAEKAERVSRLARSLSDGLDLLPGDRVALAMKNCPQYSEVLFAVWHAGLVAVPMNAKLHPKEFAYILENSGAQVCFVSGDLKDSLTEAAQGAPELTAVIQADGPDYEALIEARPLLMYPTIPDNLAWLFYTSGTTGRPKGAMLSHRNLMSMTDSYFACVDRVTEEDRIIHAAPMSHGSGLYILPHVAKGACQVIPDSGGFDPDEIFDLLKVHQGVTFFFAPTMVTRLINAPRLAAADTGNLKTIVYGGGPMYGEDCRKALELLGPKLVQIYGQGEAPMTITVLSRDRHSETGHPRYRQRLASVGVAQSGVEVRTVDEEGRDVGTDVVGEVLVRGDVVMGGYWQDREASTETLHGGWLHTGDMGVLDEDGFLTLKDRSKDVIISGGSNIYPREVEEVILRHDGVLECSVVGRPHADWGEEVIAFVVARDANSVSEADLDTLCLENIARFKRPKAYRFIEALPKNNYGKVLKTELRRLLEGG